MAAPTTRQRSVHADDLRTVQQSMLRHIGVPDHTIADVATELGGRFGAQWG